MLRTAPIRFENLEFSIEIVKKHLNTFKEFFFKLFKVLADY